MKTILFGLVLSVLCLGLGAAPARAQDSDEGDVSFQTFYDQLGNDGTWIQTDDYGYVFQPNVNDPNWSPYTNGHWAYNQEVGWIWVSDEPWGWATYHYGRWTNLDGVGWCWVPGYHWAPAWVSWRYGGGYCGWAPLPPDTSIGVDFGDRRGFGGPGRINGNFHFGGDVDVAFHIGAGAYNFVPIGHLGDPRLRGRIINRNNNFGVINRTTNITNITNNTTNVTNNYVINNGRNVTNNRFGGIRAGGPPITEINAASARPVPTVHLTTSRRAGIATQRGDTLALYAPRVRPTGAATVAHPNRVSGDVVHAAVNRGDDIQRPLVAYRGAQAITPTEKQVQQARVAQAHASTQAQIAPAVRPISSEPAGNRTDFSSSLVHHPAVTPAEAPAVGVYHPSNPNNPNRASGFEERSTAPDQRSVSPEERASSFKERTNGPNERTSGAAPHPMNGAVHDEATHASSPQSHAAAAGEKHTPMGNHPTSAPEKPHAVAAKPEAAHEAKPGEKPPNH